MAEIDDEKALLHGGYDGMNTLSDTVVVDLNLKVSRRLSSLVVIKGFDA